MTFTTNGRTVGPEKMVLYCDEVVPQDLTFFGECEFLRCDGFFRVEINFGSFDLNLLADFLHICITMKNRLLARNMSGVLNGIIAFD